MRRIVVVVAALVIIVGAGFATIKIANTVKMVSGFASAASYEPKPIPAEGKDVHDEVFGKKLDAFNHRLFVEAYQKHGQDDPQHRDSAVRFLEGYVAWMKAGGKIAELPALVKQGQELVQSGCSDPLVTTCVGIAMFRSRLHPEASEMLRRGLEGFEGKHSYPGYCASLAPKYLILTHRELKSLSDDENEKWMRLTTEWMAKAQADETFLDDEMCLRVTFTLDNNIFPEQEWGNLYAALKKQRGVDPYILNLVLGASKIKEAWAERGSGWANTVTDKGWKGFDEHLNVAREALTKAWKLHPEYPYAPAQMITVAMAGKAGPGETPRMWFDRTVAAQWDFPPAYPQLMCATLPRWGGSVEELFAFAEECVKTQRYDSPVPWYFVTLMKTIEDEEGSADCWKRPETCKLLDEMFDGYNTGSYRTPQWFKSARAALAWYAGREDDCKRLIAEAGDGLVPGAFLSTIDVSYSAVKKAIESGMRMWEPVQWSENGHYYQMCRPTVARTWDEAKAAAEAMTYEGKKGHLVAFNSGAERDFVGGIPNVPGLYLIGALKSANSGKASEGWTWTTGEKWGFGFDGDPAANRQAASDVIGGLATDGSGLFTWYTFGREVPVHSGFIVEYE